MTERREIITHSEDGEIPCKSVNFVNLNGHHPLTQKLLHLKEIEIVAERLIKRVPEWNVVVRRVAVPAVAGLAAGVAVYKIVEHIQEKQRSDQNQGSKKD